MFYFFLTIAYYSFLSLFGQLLLVKMGYYGVLGSLAVHACLTFTFSALALQKFRRPHKKSQLGVLIGAWFAIFGLATIFLRENYYNGFTFCLGLLTTCVFTSFGLIIMLYNKTNAISEKKDVSLPVVRDDQDYDLSYIISEITDLLRNPRIHLDRQFGTRLYNCQVYLLELNRVGYPIKKAFLEQLYDLLRTYKELRFSLIPTVRSLVQIRKIEESFEPIEYALRKMYMSYEDTKLEEADIKTEVMVDYLNLNGYLDDQFSDRRRINSGE